MPTLLSVWFSYITVTYLKKNVLKNYFICFLKTEVFRIFFDKKPVLRFGRP